MKPIDPLWNQLDAEREERDYQIVDAMECYGGGFVKALAQAWRHGDPINRRRIKMAFADYWQEYESQYVTGKGRTG